MLVLHRYLQPGHKFNKMHFQIHNQRKKRASMILIKMMDKERQFLSKYLIENYNLH